MSAIVTLDNGDSFRLDRRLSISEVSAGINSARGDGKLVPFELDSTPTGKQAYIDPDHVVSVHDSRFRRG